MTTDLRFQLIRRTVAELVAFEGEVAGRLERAQQLSSGHPDALAAIKRLQPMVQTHPISLLFTSRTLVGPNRAGRRRALSLHRERPALSEVLRDLCLAFHHCALSYAMLYEVALRLYEPRLREIAPKHLKAHDAALSTARLLPGVVAWQLAQDGLHCACICPMCGVGACGCVAFGTQTLTAAWHDAVPTESEPPGFVPSGKRAGAGWGARRRTGPRGRWSPGAHLRRDSGCDPQARARGRGAFPDAAQFRISSRAQRPARKRLSKT